MKTIDTTDFDYLSLKLASPDRIRDWSFGEVTKPETINYRTGRSERGGLFDERIFGPEKDYECYCGKYRRIRYKGIICEKCGVEVTKAIVRRERMGHIELASPVSHVWFLRGSPSRMSILLNIPLAQLERVVYFAGYIVTRVNDAEKSKIEKGIESEYKTKSKATTDETTLTKLKELLLSTRKEITGLVPGLVLSEAEFHNYSVKYVTCFEAAIGAEAIYSILKNLNLETLKKELDERLEGATGADKEKTQKRLSLVRSMIHSGIKAEWMFLTTVPVIPPALRPMVALEGGRHATSDLNDLYRRVINRNNRLRKLKEIGAPDVILRNEKRILQEAVDALIDNSIARQKDSQAVNQTQKRALKSLSDNLKSKQGLFRQNLLGKRVDYSGRSVIVIGPKLGLDQCGLPKHMALELFRPFVISKLIKQELAFNIRGANRLIEEGLPEVWAILEEVIQGKNVLLNRAPTLHRLGIQAFHPVLIEGNAIQLHPLVCTAFNADFDGDMMGVYVPLSDEAQHEAQSRMAATGNLLKPANGDPIVNPSNDIVLGIYWLTRVSDEENKDMKIFESPNAAITAYDFDSIGLRTKIKVLGSEKAKYAQYKEQVFETSVGRILFNSVLPADFPFVNDEITKKKLSGIVDDLIAHYGFERTWPILDSIKNFGFYYAMKSGTTFGIDSVAVPEGKAEIVKAARAEEAQVIEEFNDGLLSEEERYQKVIEIWEGVKIQIEDIVKKSLKNLTSVHDMVFPGARGSIGQLAQMVGMKGLIINTAGNILDFPIVPSYKEGLSPLEYFTTTHGARKGLADTALKTAEAGYLTRKLVVVSQDVMVTEADCGTKEGKIMTKDNISGIEIPLSKNIRSRVLAADLKTPEKTYKRGTLVTKVLAREIEATGVTEVLARTPLLCKLPYGVCQQCYGLDLARDRLVDIGEAVGVVAAQAIGEPGTQLTLRTFHSGGVAGADITQGLPRVVEIFERRIPKNPAVIAHADGTVLSVEQVDKDKVIKVLGEAKAKGGAEVEYVTPPYRVPIVKAGDSIVKGQILTDGSADLSELFKYAGTEATEEYVIQEILKVYELQGASISRKHIEIIVRQMFSKRMVKDAGDTTFTAGDIIETSELADENEQVRKNGGDEAKAEVTLLGITNVSLSARSFLAAASFQNTNKVLIDTAIRGGFDPLRGLMENVIVGRLIPAGTGYDARQEAAKTLSQKEADTDEKE